MNFLIEATLIDVFLAGIMTLSVLGTHLSFNAWRRQVKLEQEAENQGN